MQRTLHTIDADSKIAGRLASEIAKILQGKNKASYQPNTDCGDSVEIVNVDKIRFSGKKLETKVYHRVSGYPSGVKTTKLSDKFSQNPEMVLRDMVKNMLPKNKLRARMLKRLAFTKKKS